MMSSTIDATSVDYLARAIECTISQHGMGLLADPKRFYSTLADYCGNAGSAEMSILSQALVQNEDDLLLSEFAMLSVKSGRSAVVSAVERAAQRLVKKGIAKEDDAYACMSAFGLGLGRALGVEVGTAESLLDPEKRHASGASKAPPPVNQPKSRPVSKPKPAIQPSPQTAPQTRPWVKKVAAVPPKVQPVKPKQPPIAQPVKPKQPPIAQPVKPKRPPKTKQPPKAQPVVPPQQPPTDGGKKSKTGVIIGFVAIAIALVIVSALSESCASEEVYYGSAPKLSSISRVSFSPVYEGWLSPYEGRASSSPWLGFADENGVGQTGPTSIGDARALPFSDAQRYPTVDASANIDYENTPYTNQEPAVTRC